LLRKRKKKKELGGKKMKLHLKRGARLKKSNTNDSGCFKTENKKSETMLILSTQEMSVTKRLNSKNNIILLEKYCVDNKIFIL